MSEISKELNDLIKSCGISEIYDSTGLIPNIAALLKAKDARIKELEKANDYLREYMCGISQDAKRYREKFLLGKERIATLESALLDFDKNHGSYYYPDVSDETNDLVNELKEKRDG